MSRSEEFTSGHKVPEEQNTPENRKHYSRGFQAASGANATAALDRADMRGVHKSWYVGFEDQRMDLPKWHSLTCSASDHNNCPKTYDS